MKRDDIHGTEQVIKRTVEKLKNDKISKDNLKLILDHEREHNASGDISPGRRLKYLSSLRQIALILGKKDFKTASKKEFEGVWSKRKEAFNSDESIFCEAKLLKKFMQWVYELEEGYPDSIKWLKPDKPNEPTIRPSDILTFNELVAMTKVAENHPRNICLLHLLYDTGGRVSEIVTLRLEDVYEKNGDFELHIRQSKTKLRNPETIISTPSLRWWMEQHPYNDDKSKPLFFNSQDVDKPMSYKAIREIIADLAKAAKIGKRVTPQTFRRTSISEASGYMSQADMSTYFGHIQGTSVYRRYIQENIKRAKKSRRKHYNKEEAEEIEAPEPLIKCLTCSLDNLNGLERCSRCHSPLSYKEAFMKKKFDTLHTEGLNEYWKEHPEDFNNVKDFISEYVAGKLKKEYDGRIDKKKIRELVL